MPAQQIKYITFYILLIFSDKKSVTEVDGSPPVTPSTPFIRSYTGPNNNTNNSNNIVNNTLESQETSGNDGEKQS